MKTLVLAAIRFYQRIISPRKGFCCAYAAYTGHASCSALGYRAVRRLGALRGLLALNRRLEKCDVAYRRYRPAPMHAQAGFVDCDCDIVDCLPDDCGKDKKRRNKRADRDVVIPPRQRR